MKEKIKSILIGVLIGFIALPIITFGGSFVSSLIQGKTVEEAVQILAEQIDILIGRVEIIEIKQTGQEKNIGELQTELFSIKNKEVCDKLKYFEDRIQSFKNAIPEIEKGQIAYINQCQPYLATIPQKCWDIPNDKLVNPTTLLPDPGGINRLGCAYQYDPQIPKECVNYPEEIGNYKSALANYQSHLSEILSNPEYLQVKEQCVK